MKRTLRPVMTTERAQMRAFRAEGLSFAEIGKRMGRSAQCAYLHARDVPKPLKRDKAGARVRRLTRMERFIASCNRAVAEARP